MNFNFVTKRLATGSAINSNKDVNNLITAGITHIIDCRDDFDDLILLIGQQLTYLWNGTADDGNKKSTEWFKKSLDFALPALLTPRNKIYCHCEMGINRGPSTVYCIMIALGYSFIQARAQIILHRPITVAGIRYADDAESAVKELGYC